MTRDLDPEVLADLRLRDATVRARGTGTGTPEPAYAPSPTVGTWACRYCRVPCAVTGMGVDQADMFDRMLVARREPPLDRNRILICDRCRPVWERQQADRSRERDEELGQVIRALKASRNPEADHTALRRLQDLGHPDIPGLMEALRGGGKNKRRVRDDDA